MTEVETKTQATKSQNHVGAQIFFLDLVSLVIFTLFVVCELAA